MKDIIIRIRTDKDKIFTALKVTGDFNPNSMEDRLFIIGVLEHLKTKEQEKLKTQKNARFIKGDENEKT